MFIELSFEFIFPHDVFHVIKLCMFTNKIHGAPTGDLSPWSATLLINWELATERVSIF